MSSDIDLSIAQVEAELRAAEAYLTTALRGARREETDAGATQERSPYERVRQPIQEGGSAYFNKPARVRTPIPDDRRREILAKLSAERQTAVRGNRRIQVPSDTNAPALLHSTNDDSYSEGRSEERSRTITFAMQDENDATKRAAAYQDKLQQPQYYGHVGSYSPDRRSMGDDDGDAVRFDNEGDDGEVFYASDVIGKPHYEDIKPRTALDLFNDDEDSEVAEDMQQRDSSEGQGASNSDLVDDLAETVPTNYRPSEHASDFDQAHEELESSPASLFAKLLARREDWNSNADIHISHLLASPSAGLATGTRDISRSLHVNDVEVEDAHAMRQVGENNIPYTRQEGEDEPRVLATHGLVYGEEFSASMNPITSTKARSRIDTLAQPRTRVFADREKQRLVNEMDALKECTFQPLLLKASRPSQPDPDIRTAPHTWKRQTKSVRFEACDSTASKAFPWLTLSPRKTSASPKAQRRRHSLIDRLNLDVTVKFEARELLREILETEKMRECTFQPQINPVSRRLLSRTDYKPIHERVGDVQREKVEYIQRIRQELAYEEGAFTFTPQINPRSREIADTVLVEKQVSKIRATTRNLDLDDEQQMKAMLRPPAVTERLVQDAELMAEKRVAAQEYYDALEEKAFMPVISQTSNRIIQERPEFKLDFVSRQEYFRMVEQERLEALEDVVHHEQELTFRPDIGNADKVLMRPDLVQETPQQRLERLTYHEPRRKEMRKQRLREEAHAKHSFKPEINLVSQALAEKAKAEVMAKATRRHDLQRYFTGKQFRSRVAKELEQAEKAECTFRPQLVSRPKVKSSSTSKLVVKDRELSGKSIWRSDTILHTIETQRQKRAEELDAKRNALELKELENCTFQPTIHRPPRRVLGDATEGQEKPIVVRGLGRFLELKERAKRQQEEQKQREDKVFNPNHGYEPRSYTVPKPFKLSEASKDSIRRRMQLREEMRAQERTQCTFAPRTLEAQQRQVLRALLKDP